MKHITIARLLVLTGIILVLLSVPFVEYVNQLGIAAIICFFWALFEAASADIHGN